MSYFCALKKVRMKRFLLPLLLLFTYPCFLHAQKDIYTNARFDAYSQDHQVLAIIPFTTRLDLEGNLEKQELEALQKEEGYAVQDALQTYFGRGKKRKKFTVSFQNTDNTNALLAKNDIGFDNIDTYTIRELSDILGVDGIISGTLDLNILLSRGVPEDFNVMDFLLGDADYGRIGIKISDGESGKLLWKYEHRINKKSGRNTEDLIDKMMKKATRKFPYDMARKSRE